MPSPPNRATRARCLDSPRAATRARSRCSSSRSGAAARLGAVPDRDETAAFVARHHDALAERFALTSPPWDDPALGLRQAPELRARRARRRRRTRAPLGPRERRTLAAARRRLPARPQAGRQGELQRADRRQGVARRRRAQSCIARYDEAVQLLDPAILMVQELIPGGRTATAAALVRRSLRGRARRSRRWSPGGHASTRRTSVARAPSSRRSRIRRSRSRRGACSRELGFDGLVEVEFKRDPRDGELKLLDINPRVWGWHTLAQRAGVDFPYLLWRLARGERSRRGHRAAGRALGPHVDRSARVAREVLAPADVGPRLPRSLRGRASSARSSPATTSGRPCRRCRQLVSVLARRLAGGDAV